MELSSTELMELQRQANARNGRADSARHARLILLLSEGLTWAEIRAKLDCSDSYIDRWSKRFASERLAGLFARHAGRERYDEVLRWARSLPDRMRGTADDVRTQVDVGASKLEDRAEQTMADADMASRRTTKMPNTVRS